jgi:hypothetical protein
MSDTETKTSKNITISRDQFFDFIKVKDFVDADTQHYLEYFDRLEKTGKKGNWNWAAFFVPILWFFYRRMYLLGCLAILLQECLSFLQFQTLFSQFGIFFNLTLRQEWYLSLIVEYVFLWIPMAIYADYIYLRWVSYKIKRGISKKTPSTIPLLVYVGIFISLYIAEKCLSFN